MASNQIKSYPVTLVIREIQIKSIISYPLNDVRKTDNKLTLIKMWNKAMCEMEPFHCDYEIW